MKLNLEKLPKRFNKDTYFNIKTNEVIELDSVDEVLSNEVEKVFEDYYKEEKCRRLYQAENRLTHKFVYDKAQIFFDVLLGRDYMKQRDALAFLDSVSTTIFSKTLLIRIVKDYPKEYKEIIEKVLDTIKGFSEDESYDDIEDMILTEDDLIEKEAILSKTKFNSLSRNQYILNIVRNLYTICYELDEFDEYLDKELDKYSKEIQEDLVNNYDTYKSKNFNSLQKRVAGNIINLFDYVYDNNLISWVDDGKYIYMKQGGEAGDLVLGKGSLRKVYKKNQVKEIELGGTQFTAIV